MEIGLISNLQSPVSSLFAPLRGQTHIVFYSMSKKIALVHYTAPPVVGGVESVLGHHARLMAAAGHEVAVIAGRGANINDHTRFIHMPLADSRNPDVMAAKESLDAGQIPAGFGQLVASIAESLQAATAGMDVLIAHNVCSLHKNLALTAALRRMSAAPGAPQLILWHHDLAWTAPRYQSELHDGWPWDLLRQEWPEVGPKHVVVSELRRRELAELLDIAPAGIRVIPSGLDAADFLKLEAQTAGLVQTLALLEAAPLLLLPVRITPRKNIELALRALAAMGATMPEAALVVTGPPGPHNPSNQGYFEELKLLRDELGLNPASPKSGPVAHFLAESVAAYLPDPVIGDLYRLADALFLPSREEGFGIPALEAGLVGLPVFCADIPSLREITGDWATRFSPNVEPAALADLITTRLQSDSVFQLRRRVRQKYTWEQIYVKHIAPLLEVE